MKKILCLLLCAVFLACTDEDNIPVPKPVITEETVLGRVNEIYDIKIPGDADWTVTKNPKWASPMNRTGEAGTSLSLFVETNNNDADRRDSLVISLSNGGKVSLPLRQHGRASSDENDDAINMAATDLLQKTRGVGCGIDVIAPMTGVTSEKYNIRNTPFNLGALNEVIKAMGWEDAIVDEPVYSSRYETVTGNSTGAIGNQLGVNAGIEVGVKAFKFSVEAGYTSSSQSNTQSYYAIQEIQHIVASRYVRAGLMRYLARHENDFKRYITVAEKEEPTIFAETFYDDLVILQSNLDEDFKEEAMQDLLDTYGTHIVCHGTLGGEMKVSMQMSVDAENSASNIHAALSLSAKVVNVRGEFEMSDAEKMASSKTTLSLRSFGGNNPWTIAPGETFTGFKEKVQDKSKLDKWVQSIKDSTALALIDVQTIPIWDLMPTDKLRDKLRNYVVVNYQKKWYGNDFKPDIYEVTGFDVTSNAPGYGSIYLPDIELQIDMERTIVDSLSKDELSTVIYSGPKGSVDHTRGFFVGSLTRKPCKFRREKNGTFTTEVFDRLKEAAIGTLYVDASGDITIASKVSSGMEKDLYQVDSVTNWKHDLKVLTSDWTFKDDITVEGKTDYCIHIADGTTLTLDNVTINNQIVCDGNATIILKDGTKNAVICPYEHKAGVQAGPIGKTLTISGNGELTAKGGLYSAGIGGVDTDCGNITITGGSITASGSQGAGIGSGWTKNCGDITITGGTITANGGQNCAGIGTAGYGSCGKIEISGGTITANGTFCAAGIGTGWNGKCADITISGGTVKAIGGYRAAGIGAGCGGQCGNITIKSSVTYVEATCGKAENKCLAIGYGDVGTCGNVTIEDYSKVKQNNPNSIIINLNELTCDFELSGSKCTLYGTTDYAITIPDGLQVELAEVTINNQVTCKGNATIILKDNSHNMIYGKGRGRYTDAPSYALLNGPAGTTLVIDGNGRLFCNVFYDGKPSIGGGEGNIHIKGGDVSSIGGEGAAGIGSALGGKVGNITISGGEVFCTGSAALGAGQNGRCGDILIQNCTLHARGFDGDPSIGSGAGGSCGNIDIKKGAVVYCELISGNVYIGAAEGGSCGSVTIENGANISERIY